MFSTDKSNSGQYNESLRRRMENIKTTALYDTKLSDELLEKNESELLLDLAIQDQQLLTARKQRKNYLANLISLISSQLKSLVLKNDNKRINDLPPPLAADTLAKFQRINNDMQSRRRGHEHIRPHHEGVVASVAGHHAAHNILEKNSLLAKQEAGEKAASLEAKSRTANYEQIKNTSIEAIRQRAEMQQSKTPAGAQGMAEILASLTAAAGKNAAAQDLATTKNAAAIATAEAAKTATREQTAKQLAAKTTVAADLNELKTSAGKPAVAAKAQLPTAAATEAAATREARSRLPNPAMADRNLDRQLTTPLPPKPSQQTISETATLARPKTAEPTNEVLLDQKSPLPTGTNLLKTQTTHTGNHDIFGEELKPAEKLGPEKAPSIAGVTKSSNSDIIDRKIKEKTLEPTTEIAGSEAKKERPLNPDIFDDKHKVAEIDTSRKQIKATSFNSILDEKDAVPAKITETAKLQQPKSHTDNNSIFDDEPKTAKAEKGISDILKDNPHVAMMQTKGVGIGKENLPDGQNVNSPNLNNRENTFNKSPGMVV